MTNLTPEAQYLQRELSFSIAKKHLIQGLRTPLCPHEVRTLFLSAFNNTVLLSSEEIASAYISTFLMEYTEDQIEFLLENVFGIFVRDGYSYPYIFINSGFTKNSIQALISICHMLGHQSYCQQLIRPEEIDLASFKIYPYTTIEEYLDKYGLQVQPSTQNGTSHKDISMITAGFYTHAEQSIRGKKYSLPSLSNEQYLEEPLTYQRYLEEFRASLIEYILIGLTASKLLPSSKAVIGYMPGEQNKLIERNFIDVVTNVYKDQNDPILCELSLKFISYFALSNTFPNSINELLYALLHFDIDKFHNLLTEGKKHPHCYELFLDIFNYIGSKRHTELNTLPSLHSYFYN